MKLSQFISSTAEAQMVSWNYISSNIVITRPNFRSYFFLTNVYRCGEHLLKAPGFTTTQITSIHKHKNVIQNNSSIQLFWIEKAQIIIVCLSRAFLLKKPDSVAVFVTKAFEKNLTSESTGDILELEQII